MQTTSLFRRAAALALTLVLAVSASLAGFATYDMPIQTVSDTESVYLFNLDTGKPILDQNAGQSRYIASLTKMMTALLFLESGKDLNEEITIPTSLTQEFKDIQNANGSTMNLRIGETVRRIDLLYGLLVASANDAASVIASDVSGGNLPAFVSMMNQKAQELGCTGTSFTCVHGLYDYGNVSTAEDLAKIASACYANETYMQVANTQSYTLPATNLHQNERAITSTNLMLYPEVQVLLFFVIPVRVKYFGLFAAALWVFSFLTAAPLGKLNYLLCMVGFAAFFGPQAARSVRAWIRREQWKRKNRR